MKLKLFFLILFTVLINTAKSQSIDQIKADRNTYIWGEGSGTTLKTADNEALSVLISQISTQVESSFDLYKKEVTVNNKSELTEKVNSIVKTYSDATLRNTDRIIVSNEPDAKVFRYIKRAELNKIFEQRKQKILELAEYAETAENENKIADALRYFYWGLTLLKSHPTGDAILYTDMGGKEQLLATWLPSRIDNIFSGLSCNVSEIKDEESYKLVVLNIKYKGSEVLNFDYSYWDGTDWSNLISAKDGTGFIELYGVAKDLATVQLKAEYIFEGEARINREIEDVMSKIEPVPFRKSYINVPIKITDLASTKKENEFNLQQVENTACYQKCIQKVINAIETKNYDGVKNEFSPEGLDIFNKLIQYGNAKILTKANLEFVKFGDAVICRSIPMSFSFKANSKQFVEDVVLYFNDNCKISNLSFALSESALHDILSKDAWKQKDKLILISFLEHYKTAYALKRLDYIESIFADDALIITGSMVKVIGNADNQYKNNKIIKFNRQSKEQYLKNLSYSFNSKEYINIKFEESEIRKSGKGGDIYGVQIRQNYYSSNYGDVGYLFLMVDLNNPDLPIIHVRTWQPEKDSSGNVFGMGDFN
ncbi:MAG: LPP20 family lipoprotein [Bacteroidales bacterium]|jgi:hypothetical protein|nr:LPP20 family lipoprotein [Bacteroidales bacterium]